MSHQQSRRLNAFYLDQSSLQCKAPGCTFFGNPEWLGYCSICFKQLRQYHQQQQQQHQLQLQIQQQMQQLRQPIHRQETRPLSATAAIGIQSAQPSSLIGGDQLGQQQQQQQQFWWQQKQQQTRPEQQQQQFQSGFNREQQQQYFSHATIDYQSPLVGQTMTRSASNMLKNSSSIRASPNSTNPTLCQQQQQNQSFDQSFVNISTPTSSSVIIPTSSYLLPFDKYSEKRRSQCTDKKSNVLKLLRRASTFKDKSQSTSNSPSPPSSQTSNSNKSHFVGDASTLNVNPQALATAVATTTNITNANHCSGNNLANTSTGSGLNPGNLFSNLASTTSLVMSGYDTLTNLHNTILNTAKSSFRVSPNPQADNSSMHSVSQSEYMHNASGHKHSLQQPHFLYDVAWVDCLRHTNKFAKDLLAMEKQPDKSINNLSDLVHDFYQAMNDRFENQFVYKGATPDQLELLNDNMEQILNEHIYQVISARIINEDEEHNMAIQRRIRSLNWITVEHLEIDIDFQHPVVHDFLDKAICLMIEMNSRTSSIDKLECIVQCSKIIFELLQVNSSSSHSVPISADQFLPVLVFVVIQANPPMLPADMKYLTRFSNPRRLMSGETGYYFTNLCCALEFIEKASGTSLNISEDQFMKFVNGEAVPETRSKFNTYLCDGLRTMCSNDAALEKLRRRNENRQSKIDNLHAQIDVHLETNRAKLKEMQNFASSLKQKLKPNLPKIYYDIVSQNKELANKLLPSYSRQAIETNIESDAELVDVGPTTTKTNEKGLSSSLSSVEQQERGKELEQKQQRQQQQQMTISHDNQTDAALVAQIGNLTTSESTTSLSPVEQLESDISMPQLPKPIQPELSSKK